LKRKKKIDMRKVFFCITVSFMISICEIYGQLGVVAGYDGTSIRGYSYANFKPGFHVGVTYDFKNFNDRWYFQSGLLFTSGGWTFDDYNINLMDLINEDIKDFKSDMYFIEIPLNFSYRIPIEKTRIRLDIGPYLRYGLFGSYKYKANEDERKYNAFDDAYKRLDIGVNAGIGLEIKSKYVINAAYQLAFTSAEKGLNIQYMRYRIGLSYLF
jgi:hypothetical protein